MSLISVGTVAFDSIETKYGKKDFVVGGASMYTSLPASHFIDRVEMVSIVGGDFPQSEIDFFHSRGIDTEGLKIVRDKKSFYWAGKYHDDMNGRETLVTELNVLADFNPILPETYKNTEYLMLGNLTPSIQLSVINQMNQKPHIIALDTMNFWMDIALQELLKVIRKVDILMVNDEEARQLSGLFNLVEASKKILTMGPEILIIKKGEHGCILFHKNGMFSASAIPLNKVTDPTGAGDSFAGGVMGYIAKTKDSSFENLKKAVVFGTVMASFCVEEFSNEKLKMITDKMISERLNEYKKITQLDLHLN